MQHQLPARAHRSLLKLAHVMGEEVMTVPIMVYDDIGDGTPAYTTPHAIFVARSVIEKEPHNLAVYVGHEILHHVVNDPLASSLYKHELVNVAADYIINYILKSIYGLDVRKAGVPGIYDTKFKSKSLMEACAILAKNGYERKGCGCLHKVTNPALYRVAGIIRDRLNEHSSLAHLKLGTVREIVKLTKEQDQQLFDELRPRFWRMQFGVNTAALNYDLMLRALYGRLVAPTVRYDIRKDMPYLAHEHAIALSVATAKLRDMTRNDPATALTFAQHILAFLSNWGTTHWKRDLIEKQLVRISKLKEKRKHKSFFSKSEREKFKRSIERARKKIQKLDKESDLPAMVIDENRVRVRPRGDKASTGMAIFEAINLKEDQLPRMMRTDLMHFVKRVARRHTRALRDLYEGRNRLESYINNTPKAKVSSVLEKSEEETHDHELEMAERQNVPRIAPKPIIVPKSKKKKADDEDGDISDVVAKVPKGKPGQAEEEEIITIGKDTPEEDVAEASQGDAEDESGDISDDDLDEGEVGDELGQTENMPTGGGGRELSLGEGEPDAESKASVAMKTLDIVGRNSAMLKRILIEADMFMDKLAHASRARVDPEANLDRTYTFGNDVQRADTSALVKLARQNTRLAFFADFANHALLQHSGTAPRRGSLIVALDCSGSMMGERYTIAAGFALAMFRIMSDTQRGVALIKFASNVDGVYVCDEKVPVDMLELLDCLTSPSYGGTCFDAAFEQALLLQETFGWDNTQFILTTDGDGVISGPVLAAVQEKMRVTAISVGYHAKPVRGVADARLIRSMDELRQGLITVAQTVL